MWHHGYVQAKVHFKKQLTKKIEHYPLLSSRLFLIWKTFLNIKLI